MCTYLHLKKSRDDDKVDDKSLHFYGDILHKKNGDKSFLTYLFYHLCHLAIMSNGTYHGIPCIIFIIICDFRYPRKEYIIYI